MKKTGYAGPTDFPLPWFLLGRLCGGKTSFFVRQKSVILRRNV